MAKYKVSIRFRKVLEKPMTIYASSPEQAEETAIEIVSAWAGVDEVEAIDTEEDHS